jgi:hypothetical protein
MNPGQFAPEDDRARPDWPLTPSLGDLAANRRKAPRGEHAPKASPQSSSSTQSIARVTALRHLR